jgi:hypothetical protein
LKEDKHLFDFFFETVDNREGWTLHVDEPDKKVYYKYEAGVRFISTLTECTVKANIKYLIAMVSETDMFPKWMPNIVYCNPEIKLTRYR